MRDMPIEAQFMVLLLAAAAPFIGSFLGVMIARSGQATVTGRSRCASCEHRLGPRDLIPLFSWMLLKGRCRYCGNVLGWFYPAVELAAVVPVLWAATVQQNWLIIASAVYGWLLLCLAWIDWQTQRLPNVLTVPLLACGLIAVSLYDSHALIDHAIGAIVGFFAFWTLGIIYRLIRMRDGLGLGDAKLLAGIGAWVSWEGLPTIVFLGAVITITLMLAQSMPINKNVSNFRRIAFGPGLAFAGWIVWLYGPLVPA